MLLDTKLKPLIDHRIAVVMHDGNCYRGVLTEFDAETIVLRDVEETTNDEVCWKEPGEDLGSPACDQRRGYLAWHKVALPEVMVRVNGILRIWPWQQKPADRSPEEKAADEVVDEEPPIYLSHMITFG